MPATSAGITAVLRAGFAAPLSVQSDDRVGPIARTGTSVRTGFALSRSPLIDGACTNGTCIDGTCECAASLGIPAKITGAQTIPMAKIVGPIILGMAWSPELPPGLAGRVLFCYLAPIHDSLR